MVAYVFLWVFFSIEARLKLSTFQLVHHRSSKCYPVYHDHAVRNIPFTGTSDLPQSSWCTERQTNASVVAQSG